MGRPGNDSDGSRFTAAECADSFGEHVSALIPNAGIEVALRLPQSRDDTHFVRAAESRERGIERCIHGE